MNKTSKLFYCSFEKGKKYFKEKDYSSALKEYHRLLKLAPENREVFFELGKTYYVLGQYLEAMKFLQKAAEGSSDQGNSRMFLAKIHWMQGEREQAIRELREVVAKFPQNYGAHLELGFIYEQKENYYSAIREFNKALETGPDNVDIHFHLGNIYREEGEYAKAQEEFEKTSKIKPYNEEPFYKNMILSEIEIAQKKTVLHSKPMDLGVTLTHRCNLKCKMCEFYWKTGPWDIPKTIVDEIIEYFPYLRHIYWQGGEPFLSPYFEKLFEEASPYSNLTQIVVTSGLLIDERWARKLAENNVDIIWSIDGVTKKTYEDIREGAKFEELIECIERVNKYRKMYSNFKNRSARMIMQTVILKSNYKELEYFIDFARKYEFDSLNLIPTRYTTDSENIFFSQDQEALSYIAKIIPLVFEKSKEYGIKLFNQLPCLQVPNLNIQVPKKGEHPDNPKKSKSILCHWPWKSLYTLNAGKVKPYGFCEKEVGIITKNLLGEIWNNERMQLYREKLTSNSYKNFCSKRCTSGVIPKDCLRIEQ